MFKNILQTIIFNLPSIIFRKRKTSSKVHLYNNRYNFQFHNNDLLKKTEQQHQEEMQDWEKII
jgi:hypothetical protein